MTDRNLSLDAPAKLNLSLSVVGRRPDGYHLLDSVFVLLELADRLDLTAGSGELRLAGVGIADLPDDADNLAWRGLREGIRAELPGVDLWLTKRIPTSAGLGGGSSDGAAAWRLAHAWRGIGEAPGMDDRAGLVALGADMPFFAAQVAAARVRGIGDRIEPIDAPLHEVVLVHPPFGLSTRDVFAELRPDEWERLENDLLAPARRLRPELDDLFEVVRRAGGEPKLTGSGSTIFSIADDAERAAVLGRRLVEEGLRVTVTRTRHSAASIERISEED